MPYGIDAGEQRHRPGQHKPGRDQGIAFRGRQGGQQHQHDDRRQILKQQDARGITAVAGVYIAARDQFPDHDGGGRQRQGTAGDQGHAGGKAQQMHDAGYQRANAHHLHRPGAQHDVAQGHQARDGELQAQGEQQENDAEFRQMQNALGVLHQGETGRAGDQAHQQVSHHIG